ncbi:MAG: RagB/SusD family nutrient uptake outer membrane protein [Chitinophagaceae bacterium]|nr:RagB/SusD family nutrient uptake outer membrane protein [Chitinophagaceae bacterium]
MKFTKCILCLAFTLVIFFVIGCKKFITVPPPENKMTKENVFLDDITAIAAITEFYGLRTQVSMSSDLAKFTGLSGDELSLWASADIQHFDYYTNNLKSTASANTGNEFWNAMYQNIAFINSAIEGLTSSSSLTPSIKQQLLGECYFMRALNYHYLTGLYGAIPLSKVTDPEVNRVLARSSVSDINAFIISDLIESKKLLSEQYLNGGLKVYPSSPERVRATKWAASALLARVYLYDGQYEKAEANATEVLDQSALFSLSNLQTAFKKNNPEAILQLQPVYQGNNTWEGRMFNLKATPKGLDFGKPVHLSSFLLGSFEPGDQRAIPGNWIDSIKVGTQIFWFPYKYKEGSDNPSITSTSLMTEYVMVLRLGEQYLIRAEARAKLNNITGAKVDLDKVRARAGLTGTTATDQSTILTAVFQERRVELFTEWAHRWFDLKRGGNINTIMSAVSPQKGGNWENTDQLYPIPYRDLNFNRQLTQNPGY